MLTIELINLRFHAYHGLYEEEKTLGGDYEVNVSVFHHPNNTPVERLEDTIDYSLIYELIKERMKQPATLLETFVTNVASDIMNKFSAVEEVKVSIKKINPPIISFQGSVGVSYHTKRNEANI